MNIKVWKAKYFKNGFQKEYHVWNYPLNNKEAYKIQNLMLDIFSRRDKVVYFELFFAYSSDTCCVNRLLADADRNHIILVECSAKVAWKQE